MPPEVRIEHRYPEALAASSGGGFLVASNDRIYSVSASDAGSFLAKIPGTDINDLAAHAERRGNQLVVQASVREIAGRLSFLSKDTVHRRLRQLLRAQVIRCLRTKVSGPFERPTYVLDLTNTGVSVLSTRPRSA